MALELPMFEGYTVDVRLKQFRKVGNHNIIFVDFDSLEGEKILIRYIKSLDKKRQEFKRFLNYF